LITFLLQGGDEKNINGNSINEDTEEKMNTLKALKHIIMITSQPTSLSSDLLLFNEVFLDEKQQIPILLVSVGPNMAPTDNLPHRRCAHYLLHK
jgi:hypothetical protein